MQGVGWGGFVGRGLLSKDKAVISASETALSQSTNVPASAAALDRVSWCMSAWVRHYLRERVIKVRWRLFSCKLMSFSPACVTDGCSSAIAMKRLKSASVSI